MGSICVGGDLKYTTQHDNLVNSVEFNYCSTCSICRKEGVGAIGIGRPLSFFPFFINLNFYFFFLFRGGGVAYISRYKLLGIRKDQSELSFG